MQWWPEPYTGTWDEEEAAETASRDADLELAEMCASADALYAAEKRGNCPHWSVQGYDGGPRSDAQQGLRPGQSRCLRCGRVFGSDKEWIAAADAVASGEED